MNYITIPVKWKTESQQLVESLGIAETKTSESEDKEMHFTRIDSVYSYFDDSDNTERTAFRSSGDVFITDLSVSEVLQLVKKL